MMNKDVLSKDIIKLKNNYNYAIPIAKAMFLLMKSHFPILLEADALVPVPNHPDDPFRHTKAIAVTTELANEYSQHDKPIPVISALNKILNQSTHGLSRSEREEIVENMFEFNKNESVENKNIVLVDDVLTAGNIKGRCATILKEHGAKRVWCFVIGRTI